MTSAGLQQDRPGRRTRHGRVSNVFTELQVVGRAEAVARARDAGFGAPG